MARKQKFDYFDAFVEASDYAVRYSSELVKYLEKNLVIVGEGRDPKVEHALQRFQELHELEHQADAVRHGVTEALATEFITPIEREDIVLISHEIDNVVDDLDEVLQRMYMYDVHEVNEDVVKLAHTVEKACEAVKEASEQFRNFKKPEALRACIIKINDIEDEADKIYVRAMHEVYAQARVSQSIDALGIGGILTALEKCCDACENVGNCMESVIMKNS